MTKCGRYASVLLASLAVNTAMAEDASNGMTLIPAGPFMMGSDVKDIRLLNDGTVIVARNHDSMLVYKTK